MTTTVVFGSTNDAYLTGLSTDYAAALAAADEVSSASDTSLYVGQRFLVTTYNVLQSFIQFIYTAPANTKPVSAFFRLTPSSTTGTAVARTLEIQRFDWGASVTLADWRTPAQLALSNGNRAAELSNVQGATPNLVLRAGIPDLTEVDASATKRYVINSSRNRLQQSPTGQEYNVFRSADYSGTASDPALFVANADAHLLDRTLGAQVQLSDGTTVFFNMTSAVLGEDANNLIHRSPSGSPTTISTGGDASDPRRGAQSHTIVRDASDNLYFIAQSSADNSINLRMFTKGVGYTWSQGALITAAMPSYNGTVNNVAAAWHPQGGTRGTILVIVSRVAANNVGTPIAYALVNCDHLANGSGIPFRGSGDAEPLLVAGTATDGFNNFPNETGTLLDVTQAAVGSARGFIQCTARHHALAANSGPSISRYTLNAQGTGFDSIASTRETVTGFSVKDANSKSRVLPISDSQFVTVTASSTVDRGITVRHRQNIGNSSEFGVIATVGLSAEDLATLPSASTLSTSPLWDAFYNPRENRVWVYYFDVANNRRLMRTDVDLNTGQAGQQEVEVNAAVGATGSTNLAIRVHRGSTISDKIQISVANRSSGGTHSIIYVDDPIAVPPTQPTLTHKANFDATDEALFVWEFNDPNEPSGDAQTAFRLQIDNATTELSAWDTGKTVSGTSNYTLPASSLTNEEDWRWRVMTWDETDLPSPWSEYDFFSTSGAGVVNITDPAIDNDPAIITANYTVVWNVTGTVQASYKVRVTRTDTGAVLVDTGWVVSTDTQYQVVGMITDVEYQVQVTVRDSLLVESNTATRLITPDYNAPEVPILSFTPENTLGYITVNVTNPEPAGDRPNPTTNQIHRRVYNPTTPNTAFEFIGEAIPNGAFRDYTAASGVLYEYRARAVAGESFTDSVITLSEIPLELQGVWFHNPLDPAGTIRQFLFGKDNRSTTIDTKGSSQVYAGRRFPVVEYGEHQDDEFGGTIDIPHGPTYLTEREAMREFMETKMTLVYRDNRSRSAYGTLSGYTESDQAWGSTVGFRFTRVSFDVEEV